MDMESYDFNKRQRTITFECWPRFCDAKQGDAAQFPGWPITINMDANDGRKAVGWLPDLMFETETNLVVQVVEESSGDVFIHCACARK